MGLKFTRLERQDKRIVRFVGDSWGAGTFSWVLHENSGIDYVDEKGKSIQKRYEHSPSNDWREEKVMSHYFQALNDLWAWLCMCLGIHEEQALLFDNKENK